LAFRPGKKIEMKKTLSPALQGALWMISSAIFFSLMSVFVRIAAESQGVSAWKTAEFRFLISIALVLAISFWLRDPLRFVNLPWLISRGLFGGAAASIFLYSITQIGIAKATIFTYTYPIWAGLLAPFLLKDRIRTGVWVAIATAFGGLYLIIVPSEGLGAISWMDLLALSGGLLSGWAILSIKKLHETDTSRAILFSQCFFGLIIVEAPALPEGYSFTLTAWMTLLSIGLLATIAQLQMTHAYKFIGATEGSLLCMLTPVINVLLGMIFFHEPVSVRALIGCVIVLSSCSYAAVSQHIPEGESVA
jgi:drug/metabolite transporter (DMT)-like permease